MKPTTTGSLSTTYSTDLGFRHGMWCPFIFFAVNRYLLAHCCGVYTRVSKDMSLRTVASLFLVCASRWEKLLLPFLSALPLSSRWCKRRLRSALARWCPVVCAVEGERLICTSLGLRTVRFAPFVFFTAGFRCREYAPKYALRSYFYLLPSVGAARASEAFLSLFGLGNDKPQVSRIPTGCLR